MKAINPVGGTENPNRVGDVIFVHGLNGDYMKSWSYNDSKDGFWPLWLAEDCPDLGVWSIGYQVAANAWGGGHAMPLFDRATNILEELMVEEILGNKPVCFVTHSMGGLLVKRMLYTAHTIAPRYRRLMDTVCGLIFLATPHTGSDVAGIVNYLSLVFRPTDAVRDLEPHAPPLRDMNIWYRQKADSLGIQTKVYVEGEPMVGKWIVNPSSSDPAVPNVIPIHTDANHINIAKPPSRDELVYRGCRKFVEEVLSRQNVSTNQVKGQAGHVATSTGADVENDITESELLPLRNSNFEVWRGRMPVEWFCNATTGWISPVRDTKAYGNKALEIGGNRDNDAWVFCRTRETQVIPILRNSRIKLSFKAKKEQEGRNPERKKYVELWYHDGSGWKWGFGKDITEDQWTDYETEWWDSPAKAQQVSVGVVVEKDGAFRINGVELRMQVSLQH